LLRHVVVKRVATFVFVVIARSTSRVRVPRAFLGVTGSTIDRSVPWIVLVLVAGSSCV